MQLNKAHWLGGSPVEQKGFTLRVSFSLFPT